MAHRPAPTSPRGVHVQQELQRSAYDGREVIVKVGVYTQYHNFSDWPRFLEMSDAPPRRTDQEIIDEELALADLVEPLGFDSYWAVDHYVTPYAMTGGVLQHLAHIAGRTKRIDGGMMGVGLPWDDPMPVAHQISS